MPSQPDPRLDPLLTRPGMPTGLQISTEITHSRPVHAGPGQIVPVHPFHLHAHVATTHGLDGDIVPLWEHVSVPGERSAGYSFPHRQGNGKSESKAARQLLL